MSNPSTPLSEARRLLRHESLMMEKSMAATMDPTAVAVAFRSDTDLLKHGHGGGGMNGNNNYGTINHGDGINNLPFSATAPSLFVPRSRRSSTHALIPRDPHMSTWRADAFYFWIMLKDSPVLSFMLAAIPFGLIVHYTKWSYTISFILNFIAIIPLAWLLGNATEELALRTSQTIGGLLNATFGNAVELIVSVVALRRGYIQLVQTSLLGSILSNMLLVLGMSFFLGGLRFSSQVYNRRGAHVYSSMLLLACVALALPTCFMHSFTETPSLDHLLDISRATATIMFGCYLLYLFFQLYTHASIFDEVNLVDVDMENGDTLDEPEPELTLSTFSSLTLLTIVTVLVSLCCDALVASIEGFTREWKINPSFVGLILIPIVGNAAEHATAVRVAMKDKLDLSIGVAIGSSTQIALFLIPFLTLLGWAIGEPMSLDFNPFESVVMVLSVLMVNFVVKDGSSNWLEGVLLISAYLIIAVMFWFHPPS